MSCVESNDKKYISRPSPPYPANQCPEGLVKIGNDGNKWIIKRAANGVHRWAKYNYFNVGEVVTTAIQKPVQASSKVFSGAKSAIENLEKLTVAKIRESLDREGIKYKKSAKKSELLELLKNPNRISQIPAVPAAPIAVQTTYDKLTVAKLKELLDSKEIKYKKSAKKSELLELLKIPSRTNQIPVVPPPAPKQTQETSNIDKLSVAKLKQLLDREGIKYKKSAKKSELIELFKNPGKVVDKPKKSGKIINLAEFKNGNIIDLNPLGKYYVKTENEYTFRLSLKNVGDKIIVPEKITYQPRLYDIDELRENKLKTSELRVGDILNLGDYRLFNGYIVMVNSNDELYLENLIIDDNFAIPYELSSRFENPVKAYSDIDDVGIIEMKVPNVFLENKYGLTLHSNIPKDLVFEYVVYAEQMNVMIGDTGRGFTIETNERGQNLARYITQKATV
jgi:hypothetical protein